MKTTHLKATKRSAVHGSLKLILLVSGIFLVLGLMFWSSIESAFFYEHEAEEHSFEKKVNNAKIKSKEVAQPRFVSEDEKNRPYVVSAKRGENQEDELIKLDKVIASMEVSDEGEDRVAITSHKGLVKPGKEGKADLSGQVTVSHNKDYTLFTDKAHVDFEKGEIITDQEVEGEGIYGAIQAQGLHLNSHHKTLELKGKTKIRIDQLKGEASESIL